MSLRTECHDKKPLTKEAVEVIYELRENRNPSVLATWVKNLCLSHEKLRLELETSEMLQNLDKTAQ